jgi:Putative zinc-finger
MTGHPCDGDAAYLVGALGPAERREYEAHLAACTTCRASLVDLSGPLGALHRVPAQTALAMISGPVGGPSPGDGDGRDAHTGTMSSPPPPPPVPDRLLDRLTERAASWQRRRRRRVVLAIAGGVLAGAAGAAALPPVLGLARAGDPPVAGARTEPGGRPVALQPRTRTALVASMRLEPAEWGTVVHLTVGYAEGGASGPPGARATYALCVVGMDGSTRVITTWMGTVGRPAGPTGTTALRADEIRAVEIRMLPSDQLLLTARPRGVTTAPTGPEQ